MSHYKSNVRDLEFNLFEALRIDEVLSEGRFSDLDSDTVRTMLEEAARLAEGPVAATFAAADRNPPSFDPDSHSVTLRDDFKESAKAWLDAGWLQVGMPEEIGGVPAPSMVSWAINEFLLGAHPAVFLYLAGPMFASILHEIGNEQQKKWAVMAIERQWGATMVLTEPDAGSDVGAGRAKAIEQPDGTWHIEGTKRFITGGDSGDLFENIFHLVLARPEGAGPGTRGLSLFFVPKFHFDEETGEIGERNGVYVTGIEDKMGIKASATCDMTFGEGGVPAKGWLVGDVHSGIAQMFKVIENARMMVGTKAIATLSTGYLNALEYAKERVQGADMTQMTDKTAPRVTIMHHPDVRRSLMTQKAYAEGLRSVYLYTAAHQDVEVAEIVSGADAEMAHRVNDLLLPIVKGVGSERAYAVLTESLQVYGGSGYLRDYPIEQYIRDAKIDSLYEGTTAIQAQDFFFRKIVRDQGAAFGHVAAAISAFVADESLPEMADERRLLGTALHDVQEMAGAMGGNAFKSQEEPREIYKVGLVAVPFLMAFGDLVVAWRLQENAAIAHRRLKNGAAERDIEFYRGKIATSRFFAKHLLPQVAATKQTVLDCDAELMEVEEAAF